MPAKKASTTVAKPTYAIMVAESIKTLNDRTGSSVQAITKQLQAQYRIDINKPAMVKAIKKGVESGDLVQIKASYKLNKKAPVAKAKKPVVVKKKPVPKKETPKRTTTKRTAKAALKPKKSIAKKPTKRTSSSASTVKKAAPKKPAARKTSTTKRKAAKK